MKKLLLLLLLTPCFGVLAQNQPVAPVKIVVDEYFGQKIEDPYQYLEDMNDEKVIEWFKGQGDYTAHTMKNVNGREALISKFKELDQRRSSRVYNLNITENDFYFYLKTTPEDETGKLFMRKGYEGQETLLFDPSSYNKEEGKQYTVGSISPNRDGSLLSFAIAPNGSESSTILVMDMKTNKLLSEAISSSMGGAAWQKDNKSFSYGKYNSDDITDQNRQINTKTYLHEVGSDSANDPVVFWAPDYPELNITPEEIPRIYYDKDADKLFMYASTVERNAKIYMADADGLKQKHTPWKQIVKREDMITSLGTDSKNFYLRSKKDAPNYKVMMSPLANTDFSKATTLIPHDEESVITDFAITSEGYFFAKRRNGVETKVYYLKEPGAAAEELELPFTAGSASLSTKGVDHKELWISMGGWTRDGARYRYDLNDKSFTYEMLSSKAEFPEFENIVAEEIMVPSHDGVMVPVSLIYDKNMKRDGKNPLMLYGYGSYGISISPFFSSMFLTWISEGGVIAIGHVRGGGELGDAWHKAGYKQTKPNTWKDFIACAEYMHKEKISSPEKTMIFGGSAGGILVGRSMTERPDLFGVVVPAVGAMNTVRSELTPNGPINVPEFGSVKDEAGFKALYEMDSYLHIKDGVKYPATMITTGINDRRVSAWEPGKFAARLQAANGSDNPILFRVDYESGHGSDAKTKQFEEFADIFSFAFWQMGHPSYQSIRTDKAPLAK
ncbi:prolyl oligopeptidase family serine peptidase [Lutimonas vermicola]|uniref:prolyl oligopeptidase n=1 Tax=Lutimonas vermicola TaxID=414288 RepID=A0ABU9L2V3_9FLAO